MRASVRLRIRPGVRAWPLAVGLILALSPASRAQSGVAATLHNLSVSGPGEVKSLTESQICKFCHIPHNAEVPQGLWGRPFSDVDYTTARIAGQGGARVPAPQPDGSSRLCLSCHDGTIALGELAVGSRSAGLSAGSRLTPGQRGYIGTDLSGSHPISFEVPDGDYPLAGADSDMRLKSLALVRGTPEVKLDDNGKMQCTTCHDPHEDRYYQEGLVPHFWVRPTVGEVCQTCHELR